MKRREFITLVGSAAAWPVVARAQQPTMPVIGFLSGRSLASDAHLVAAFRQALSEVGFVDGQNVAIEFRWADGQTDKLAMLAAELVDRKVALIFAGAVDVDVGAIKAAVATVPVVFATAGDPVALGLGASFNRPGGNATAVTVISASLWPKRLDLLREVVPTGGVVGVLVNPHRPDTETQLLDVQKAASDLGRQLIVLNTGTERDFDMAFATLIKERAAGLLVGNDSLFINRRDQIVALAARHGVPAVYERREFAAAGGLMSYGASTIDQYRQSGLYAGRILKGAKPADLPFLQPTKFELVINLKTAKALGLTVPDKLLALADEVIE
jgi:putative ABC transport system substrate-binding protein